MALLTVSVKMPVAVKAMLTDSPLPIEVVSGVDVTPVPAAMVAVVGVARLGSR